MKVRLALWTGVVLSLLACEKADPNSSDYWIERLQTEERRQAIKKLTEMRAQEAVDPLIKAYKDKRHTEQLISALVKLKDRKAIPIFLEAIQDTSEESAAKLAAQTLYDWGVDDEVDTYIKVLGSLTLTQERSNVAHVLLKILSRKPNAKATPVLLQLLAGDPDMRSIAINGMAAEVLGKLREPKALPKLIECLWMDDHLHRNVVPECRLAINRIGGDAALTLPSGKQLTAIDMLITTLERKNRAVEERAKKHKFHKSGLIEAKCAELLGDLSAKSAVEPLLAALKIEETMPVEYQADPVKQNAFKMGHVQRYISTASALAMLGDEAPVEYMLSRLDVEGGFREILIASIQQLGFLGSPKAVPGFLKRMKKEPNMLDPDGHGMRIQMAINALNVIDHGDKKLLGQFEKEIKKYQSKLPEYEKDLTSKLKEATEKQRKPYQPYFKAFKDWSKNYDTVLGKLETVKTCKDDVACWLTKLNGEDQGLRTLAAYRLAQIKDPSVAGHFIKTTEALNAKLKANLNDPQMVADLMTLRNILLFGLARQATVAELPGLEKIREGDAALAKSNKKFKGLLYPMDLLLAKLSHRK